MDDIKEKNIINTERSLQDYLSLGYVYILILGIARDSIVYYFLDVNFMNYYTLMDVMLSPLAVLTELPISFVGIFVGVGLFYYAIKKDDAKKLAKGPTEKELTEIQKPMMVRLIPLILFMLFGFFVGTGMGEAYKKNKKLKEKGFDYNYEITYLNDQRENLEIVRQTNQFLFTVKQGDDRVTIIPIAGNVKTIKELPQKEDEK